MINRYTVQHIHKRKNKQTRVAAKDPKQAMRSVIHREHGGLSEVIKWRTCQFVDGFDIQWAGLYGGGEVRIDNDDMLDIEFKCVDEITQMNEDMGLYDDEY